MPKKNSSRRPQAAEPRRAAKTRTRKRVRGTPDLEGQLEKLRARLARREAGIESLRAAVEAGRARQQAGETERAELRSSLEDARRREARWKSASEESAGARAEVEERLAAVARARDAARSSLATARRALRERDQEIARLREELAAARSAPAREQALLREQRAELERNARALEERLAGLEASLAASRKATAARDEEIAALKRTLELAGSTLAARDEEIERLRASLSATDEAIALRAAESESLREALATADRTLAARDEEIDRMAEQLAAAERRISARDAEIAGLERVVAVSEQSIEARERETARLRETVFGIQDALAAVLTSEAPSASVGATPQRRPGPAAAAAPPEETAEREPASPATEECAEPLEIHRYWRRSQIRSKLGMGGVEDVEDLFLHHLLELCREHPDAVHPILSLGAGSPRAEMELARRALAAGATNFEIHCLSRAARQADHRGEGGDAVRARVVLLDREIDDWSADRHYPLCLANRSLHRLARSETALEKIKAAIAPDGALVVGTAIGRCDRVDSPIAREIIDRIWQLMPDCYRVARETEAPEPRSASGAGGTNHDASHWGPPILPLLMAHFHFELFIAFGNLVNAFIGRDIGPNFDPRNERDRRFIDQVAALDDAKIDSGLIPPTHCVAVLRTDPVPKRTVYRHWTPEFCLGRGRGAEGVIPESADPTPVRLPLHPPGGEPR